jgi:hypothetical protein
MIKNDALEGCCESYKYSKASNFKEVCYGCDMLSTECEGYPLLPTVGGCIILSIILLSSVL